MWLRRLMPALVVSAAVLIVLPPLGRAAEPPDAMDPALVPNYRRLGPALAAAGRPSPEALRRLREWGFETVIDLRRETEDGVREEKAALASLGVRHVSVPVSPDTFSRQDVDAVSRAIAEANGRPVLLHCASSNRVGAVWAVMRVQAGDTLEAAEAEGRKAGLKSAAMVEAMKRVARERAPR
jgi:uncharacterized protein (TIGR01244 family)